MSTKGVNQISKLIEEKFKHKCKMIGQRVKLTYLYLTKSLI